MPGALTPCLYPPVHPAGSAFEVDPNPSLVDAKKKKISS